MAGNPGYKAAVNNNCNKRFTTKSSATTHNSTMHGDKNFVCEECNKIFGQLGLLRR